MTLLTRFLIRLYPAKWRRRYGEELKTLIDDVPPGPRANFDLLKGALKMQFNARSFTLRVFTLSVAGLLAGWGVSFLVTARYTSTAVLELSDDSATATRESIRSRLVHYQQDILSRRSLSVLMQDPRLDLYPRDRMREPLEDVIETMRTRDLRISLASPESGMERHATFQIAFTSPDRQKAQSTVQTLITKFIDANLTQTRAELSPTAPPGSVGYLLMQIGQLESRVDALEMRLNPHQPVSPHAAIADHAWRSITIQVIDAPSLPQSPVSPNRSAFALAGLGAGVAAALLLTLFRKPIPPVEPLPVD